MGSLIRTAAVLACAIVALSFALFVIDEASAGSKEQVGKLGPAVSDQLNAPNPGASEEALRERVHGQPREAIDDVNDVLTAPVSGLGGDSVWARRMIALVLGLLVYGVLGGILANAFQGPARETQDWREATG